MILRTYQRDALQEIRAHYALGVKKVLLWLPTGAGKTLCFCQILKSAYEKGNRAMMVVSGAALVDQASQRLAREGVPHGVMQANHWRRMPDELIQVCSIHTLYKRKIIPEAVLIVIDEAHLAASPSFKWLIEHYPNAYFLPVTATPYVKGGMRHIADKIVHPITMNELIEQGYLSKPRYYVPSRIDLSKIEIDKKTKDYKSDQLEKTVRDARLYGDMVDSYNKYGKGRPALAFALSVAHSQEIVETFNAAGIRSEHIDAKTPADKRADVISRLEKGELDIVCNVGVLTTGVDIPAVSCIILARPTKSYNLFIQIVGRGTRIYDGKENFIVLDHADNILEHGMIEHEMKVDLDGKTSKPKEERVIVCGQCFFAFNAYMKGKLCCDCPECGFSNSPPKEIKEKEETNLSTVTDLNSVLKEIKSIEHFEEIRLESFIKNKVNTAKMRGYKKGWVFFQVKGKFGEAIAKRYSKRIDEDFSEIESRHSSLENNRSFKRNKAL